MESRSVARRWQAKDVVETGGKAEARPRLRLSGGPGESHILRHVLKFLQLHPKVAWAQRMNTGAGFLATTPNGVGRWIRFGFEGAPDVIGQTLDGMFLAVEIKSEHGIVTEAQRMFLDLVAGHGGISGVVRNLTDIERLLT